VAAVVTVLLLLVAGSAAFMLRHRTRGTAHAAEQAEIQQAEDQRNTLKMEDNPMLAATRARPVTTVHSPTFQFQQGAGVYAVPVEKVSDPTYSGYAAPGVGGTAAAVYAVSSLTTVPVEQVSDPTYSGYTAPGVGGTAAAVYAVSSLTTVPVEEVSDPTYSGYAAPSAGDYAKQHARVAPSAAGDVMLGGPTRATPAALRHRHTERCTRPSPIGGMCTTMAVNGGQFCSRHSCPKCGASKSSAAGGCPAHGGLNTEA
jgi:hypothetical protein